MGLYRQKSFWLNVCLLGIGVFFSTWLVYEYVTSECIFYYWDYVAYQEYAVRFSADLLKNPLSALLRLWLSSSRDYNDYFALLLSPFILWAGASRLGYILGVVLVYHLPYALTLGALGSQLIDKKSGAVFWSTTYLALLTPMVWVPTLRGYPDVSAAWMVALAILVYLRDTEMQWRRTPVWMGILLAGAMLLRRHFGFDVLSFYFTIVLQVALVLLKTIRLEGKAWVVIHASMKPYAKRIGLCGVAFLVTLILFGAPFLVKVLIVPYAKLYASYALSPVDAAQSYMTFFGWITWGMVIAGYGLGIWRGILKRQAAVIICSMALVNLVMWTAIVRNAATHYTLHLSTFIVLGLSAWFWGLWRAGQNKVWGVILALSGVFLSVNMVFALSPVSTGSNWQPLFSKAYPPMARNDYAEIERLVRFLRENVPKSEAIYVVDSSPLMNFSILREAEKAVYQTRELNILTVPEVDSRDAYPLEMLIQAEYVLISQPFQYHLSIEEQQIPYWVYDTFVGGLGISQDFQQLPGVFYLEDGVVLHIYQRNHPTEVSEAVRAFSQMADFIGPRPGKQPDWIILRGHEQANVSKNDSMYRIHLPPTGQKEKLYEIALLYAEKTSGGTEINAKWIYEGFGCPDLRLSMDWITPNGITLKTLEKNWNAGTMQANFTAHFSSDLDQLILINIRRGRSVINSSLCDLSILITLNSWP